MGFSFFRGATMRCDIRIQGDHEHTVLPELGDEVPFAGSATGRVILGALPDSQMFRLIEQERQSGPMEMDLVTVMAHQTHPSRRCIHDHEGAARCARRPPTARDLLGRCHSR